MQQVQNLFGAGFGVGIVVGGLIVWYGKDFIQKIVLGAQGFADKLKAKVAAIEATIKKL